MLRAAAWRAGWVKQAGFGMPLAALRTVGQVTHLMYVLSA